ncbi:hypothetical protein F5Y12DRAFT_779058, partial [Xylaria sp. FL1777]
MHTALLPLLIACFAAMRLPKWSADAQSPTNRPPPHWDLHIPILVVARHKGSSIGLTRTTIRVPVGPAYRNKTVLNKVSVLYSLGSPNVTCDAEVSEISTGFRSNAFRLGHPAVLSETSTVIVGFIVCTEL